MKKQWFKVSIIQAKRGEKYLVSTFFFFNKFILFLAVLGPRCCTRTFFQLRRAGATLCCGAWVSHCGGFSLWSTGSRHVGSVVVARELQSAGSVVVAHGLSCSAACGIFLGQGSNPCPLHWQADSLPLRHQESPQFLLFIWKKPHVLRPCRHHIQVLESSHWTQCRGWILWEPYKGGVGTVGRTVRLETRNPVRRRS